MKFQELRCDRCQKSITRASIQLIVTYHHPRTLDICEDCEGEFTIWLGKHPLWGVSLEDMAAGVHMGEGYPSKERVKEVLKHNTSEII